ncbi:MAG: gliding motility-associated C-terminal domain-containing protein [Cytophagales bacterium]|nr:MAG: gliding motility-associated C-terminal domain-containing protein [Cytophagales bacterium]
MLLWCGMLLLALPTQATHLVGGHIEMRPIGTTPGQYRITITNYFENNNSGQQANGGSVGIFRKRDNMLMMSFITTESTIRKPIIFANEKCAEQRKLNFIVATFAATITLNPATYNDPQGYYISYQTRNRNAGVNNITNPTGTGYTFYLEFPALTQNGQPFLNGSPRFPDINGEYICRGDAFTFHFGGTDPDGDELRYSMITPLNYRTNGVGPGPYPTVSWASGYGANNAIPGNPTLRVDPKTGELSVTATQIGLFVFAVNVEEFRNGQKIGEVRRDFQLLVVDCPPATIPRAVVKAETYPATAQSFTICPTKSVSLVANTNPTWYYQWQRDGLNLPGDTLPTLRATLPGEYEVVVSSKLSCVKASSSQSMSVTVFNIDARVDSSGHLCATSGTVSLSLADAPNQTYRWFVNGTLRAGATRPLLTTSGPGQFQPEITNTRYGCQIRADLRIVWRSEPMQASLSSSQTALCPNGSLTLRGAGGVNYVWAMGNTPQTGSTATFEAKTAGTYNLTAIDQYGCEGIATPLAIGQIPTITPTLDPVTPVCGTANPAVTLRGAPAGGQGTVGEYAGEGAASAGVLNGTFDPARAGIGDHVLTYTVRPAPWCEAVVTRQTAIVAPIPTIALPDTVKTWAGNSITLEPLLTGNPNQFWWSPAAFLADENSAVAQIVDIQHDTTYYFRVANAIGCEARDTVRVLVFSRIWVPDAFTPNRDGHNDVLELKGVEGFTLAEMTVLDRWGEVVYRSTDGYRTPFDGTFQGQPLPAGNYVYVLKPAPSYQTLRGRVVIMR